MACLLTSGRALGCKSSVGGLKAVYFADYGTLGTTTIVDGEITAITGTPVFFKFDLKGSSTLEQTITSSRENGTTFTTQALNLTLPILDKATQEQIKLLSVARPIVVVEDYNSNFILLGKDNGTEVVSGTIVSGAAMGDMSGFTLSMEAMESDPAFFVTSTIVTALESATQIDPNA